MGTIVSLADYRRQRLPLPRLDAEVALNLPRAIREVLPAVGRRWPAPSDWQGKRVVLRASGDVGRVVGWDAEACQLVVDLGPGQERLCCIANLERLP